METRRYPYVLLTCVYHRDVSSVRSGRRIWYDSSGCTAAQMMRLSIIAPAGLILSAWWILSKSVRLVTSMDSIDSIHSIRKVNPTYSMKLSRCRQNHEPSPNVSVASWDHKLNNESDLTCLAINVLRLELPRPHTEFRSLFPQPCPHRSERKLSSLRGSNGRM